MWPTCNCYEFDMKEKVCIKCGVSKPINDFHNAKKGKDGKRTDCKECKLAENKKWIVNNKNKWNELKKQQRRRERRTIKGNIDCRMSRSICDSLKVKTVAGKTRRKWEDIVGYSVQDLKLHLEKQFTDKMSWELFMAGGIHIDHKKPKSKFFYESTNDMDFKDCWSLDNLQPLFATDNLRKGAQESHEC